MFQNSARSGRNVETSGHSGEKEKRRQKQEAAYISEASATAPSLRFVCVSECVLPQFPTSFARSISPCICDWNQSQQRRPTTKFHPRMSLMNTSRSLLVLVSCMNVFSTMATVNFLLNFLPWSEGFSGTLHLSAERSGMVSALNMSQLHRTTQDVIIAHLMPCPENL